MRCRREQAQIVHVIQALTDLNPNATVLSIDGIGAFDMGLLARQCCKAFSIAIREAILRVSIDLFVGRPRQPALFALGQHPAFQALQAQLQDDERLFVDDVYVCSPDRVSAIFGFLQNVWFHQSSIRVHHKGSDDSRFAVCLDDVVVLLRHGQVHFPHGAPRFDGHVCSPS